MKSLAFKVCILLILFTGLIACGTGSRFIPQLEFEPALNYPKEAIEKYLEGDVELLILVNREGNVHNVKIKNGSGFKVLDDAAVKHAEKLKYFPINSLDKDEEIWIDTKIIFRLDDLENENSYIGKVWPSEKVSWIDDEFGFEITKWTSEKYESWHLYFNIESFIDADNAIIYSTRAGGVNLFRLNLVDGSITQLTNHQGRVGKI